jgi:hypothetical protein
MLSWFFRWLVKRLMRAAFVDSIPAPAVVTSMPPGAPSFSFGPSLLHGGLAYPPGAAPGPPAQGAVALQTRPGAAQPGPPPFFAAAASPAPGEAEEDATDSGPLEIAGQVYEFYVVQLERFPRGMPPSMMMAMGASAAPMPGLGGVCAGPFTSFRAAQETADCLHAGETLVLPLPTHLFRPRPPGGV